MSNDETRLTPPGQEPDRAEPDPKPGTQLDEHAEMLRSKLTELRIVNDNTIQTLSETLRGGDTQSLVNELQEHGSVTSFQADLIMKEGAESVVFDDYILLDKLGEGGMGAVYKARSIGLERIEAIKMITNVDDPNLHVRFEREAKLLARLDHSAIVPIYKFGRYEDTAYIAMKYIEGEDLKSRVDRARVAGQCIPCTRVCRWIQTAADALDYAHERGIIHRDIKPHNLMITEDGDVIVLDMGIARIASAGGDGKQGVTQSGSSMGTPDYMPPEQWADAASVTAAADIYSLGATLFFALTGRVPFPSEDFYGTMLAHTSEPVPSAHETNPNVPAGLDPIIERMMAKKPEDRYASAREVAVALEPYTQEPAEETTVKTKKPPPTLVKVASDTEERPVSPLAAVLAAAVVLVVVGGGAWWYSSRPTNDGPPKKSVPPPLVGGDKEKPGDKKQFAKVEPKEVGKPKTAEEEKTPEPKPDPLEQEFEKVVKENPKEWPTAQEVRDFVRKEMGDESDPEVILAPDGPLARETTRRRVKRLQREAREFADKFQDDNEEIWPNKKEFLQAVESITPVDEITTEDELSDLKRELVTLTAKCANPLDFVDRDVLPPDDAKAVQDALRSVLSVESVPREPDWTILASFEDVNANPIRKVKVDETVVLMFTIAKDSYVTLVKFDAHELFVLPIAKKWPGGNTIVLDKGFKLAFSDPGVKRFAVFATDEPILEKTVSVSTKDEGMRRFFGDDRAFRRVVESLERARRLPGILPSETVKAWAHTFVTLEVEAK